MGVIVTVERDEGLLDRSLPWTVQTKLPLNLIGFIKLLILTFSTPLRLMVMTLEDTLTTYELIVVVVVVGVALLITVVDYFRMRSMGNFKARMRLRFELISVVD